MPDTPLGRPNMFKLPGEEFVTIELVHQPSHPEVNTTTALSQFVIQVESVDATIAELAAGASTQVLRPRLTLWSRDLGSARRH